MANAGKFYEFRQNNSGGSFDIDDARGIGPRVWIEALSAVDADQRAQAVGIYFGGVEGGMDCECCGDRWYPAWDEGYECPRLSPEYDFGWHDTVYVHRMDGTIDRITEAIAIARAEGREG